MNNFLADLYGSEEKVDKSTCICAIIFAIASCCIGLNVWTSIVGIEKYIALFFIYIVEMTSLFTISSYFFTKKKNADKNKGIKYVFFIFTLLLIVIPFLPITVYSLISEQIKKEEVKKFLIDYVLSMSISLIVAILGFGMVFHFLKNCQVINCNITSMIVALLLWRGSVHVYFWIKNRKSDENNEYARVENSVALLIFVLITVVTIAIQCIKFDEVYAKYLKDSSNVFAIYIAVDRLIGKVKQVKK